MTTCTKCGTTSDDAPMHDAHVVKAHQVFRSCGFSVGAMRYPRSSKALAALRAFNGVPDSFVEPFAWRYHPNAWCAAQAGD